jgi:adenine phosphoribosyltransferase
VSGEITLAKALDLARPVPDFPEPGILFWDLTPVLADPDALRAVVDGMQELAEGADVIAALDARGFLFGAALAARHGYGVITLRKAGKLPVVGHRVEYQLEYGTASIETPAGVLAPGQRVLVVDDVLATGGTAAAACDLVEREGGTVSAVCVVHEITALNGRAKLPGRTVHSLRTV